MGARKIEFNYTDERSKQDIDHLKSMLEQLKENEITELSNDVQAISGNTEDFTLMERLKLKVDAFCAKHSVPLVQSLAASDIYDVLKVVFGF